MNSIEDFFNSSIPLQQTYVPTGLVNGKMKPPEDSESSEGESDDEENQVGTDYVKSYTEKEMALYAAAQNRTYGGAKSAYSGSCIDGIGDFTRMSVVEDEEQEPRLDNVGRKVHTRVNKLPIDAHKHDILSLVNSTSTIIIHGPTGCGKTTQVAQYLYDYCQDENAFCNIVVTQPRRIAAISVAKRVCDERGWQLGSECGYQVGLEKVSSPDTKISYVTTGILLQKLISRKNLTEYSHIIVDEVHERSQELDFLLLIIRRFLYTNSIHVKLILMSATFDTDKFAYYFRTHNEGTIIRAPTLFVTTESNFTTSFFYADQITHSDAIPIYKFDEPCLHPQMHELLVKLMLVFDKLDNEHETTQEVKVGHVLVFLPGIQEIEDAYAYLNKAFTKENPKNQWLIIPLHSSISNHEQYKVFTSPPEGTRKIILSTNIAESSITVCDVEYVIDYCLTKVMTVDPDTRYQCLKLEWASQINCMQRSGRVGRVRDGRVYRLVTKSFYETYLSREIKPEIQKSPLERIVLCSKLLDLSEPPKAILALAIDPPVLENIDSTLMYLKEAGGLLPTCRGEVTKIDGDLTFLGRMMSSLPLDVKLTKLICLGYMFSCLEECIIMAAGCSLSNIFTTPFQEKLKSYINRLTWADGSCSDLFAHLNLYKVFEKLKRSGAFKSVVHERQWCQKNYLSHRSMREWTLLVDEIKKRLTNMGVVEVVGPTRVSWGHMDNPMALKVVICGAFYPNYFKRTNESAEFSEREAVKILNGLNPMSTVYFTNMEPSQPVPLYAKRIKEILAPCTTNMNIHYDSSSKIYVSFLESAPHTVNLDGNQQLVGSIPGKILLDVYKSVRLRQVYQNHTISVMRANDSWKRAAELGLAEGNETGNYKLVTSNKKKETNIFSDLRLTRVNIKIIHVIDASHFFAHLDTVETDSNIINLEKILNGPSASLTPLTEPVAVGNIYATVFEMDRKYYRCKVVAVTPYTKDEILAQVLFIDFGNTALVLPGALRMLPDGVGKTLPPQAYECILSEVQPSPIMNPRAVWSDHICQMFETATANCSLSAKIYSVVNGIVSLELYKDNSPISFNQWMIDNNYAIKAEESFLSKENHETRVEAQRRYSSKIDVNAFVDLSDQVKTVVKLVEPPPEHECRARIRLRGPYSPLEVSVYGIMDTNNKVSIDNNSVNAVLLDTEPQNPHDRLLVASGISQKQNSANLTLRHTSLMPNLPGFLSMMALIFCPKMSPKPTEDGLCYASILCGLGENKQTKKSIFPAHDLVIPLDTVLDKTDLQSVNEIRYWLNKSIDCMQMVYEKMPPPVEFTSCQREIKTRLIKLLKKPRVSQERQFVKHADIWHKFMYNGEILNPGDHFSGTEIWPLHNTIKLNTQSSKATVLKRHLEELHDIACYSKSISELTCQLCNVTVYSVPATRCHLASLQHKEMLAKLNRGELT